MRFIAFSIYTFSFLGSLCRGESRFYSPSDSRDDERNGRDPEQSIRYAIGDVIPLVWVADGAGRGFRILIVQTVNSKLISWDLGAFDVSWTAQYDMAKRLKSGEDSLYYYALYDSKLKQQFAASVYFNVTAPEKENTKTVTAPPTTVTVSQGSFIKPETTYSTITGAPEETKSASDNEDNVSKPDKSRGEVAGAAVGGVVGGLLIFGAIGWVLWRRTAKMKSQSVDPTTVQYQENAVETKAELPGDNSVYPSEYAKSPTGIYEAP